MSLEGQPGVCLGLSEGSRNTGQIQGGTGLVPRTLQAKRGREVSSGAWPDTGKAAEGTRRLTGREGLPVWSSAPGGEEAASRDGELGWGRYRLSEAWGIRHRNDGPEGQKGWFSANMEAGRIGSPNVDCTTISTAGNTRSARQRFQRPGTLPLKLLPARPLSGGTVTLLPRHPRGVQRKWSPEKALRALAPAPPLRSTCWSSREAGRSRDAGGVPFSALRCRVPEPSSGDPPGAPGRGLRTRSPPPSRSPGPRPGGAASPAARTSPARRARARSASAGPAPPRPPSCGDVTRSPPTRPSSRLSRTGLRPMGAQGRGGWTAARERQRASGVQLRPRRARAPDGKESGSSVRCWGPQGPPPPRLQDLLEVQLSHTETLRLPPSQLASSTWRPSVYSCSQAPFSLFLPAG